MKGPRYVMLAADPSSDLLGAELFLALKDRWNVECHALGRMALRRAKAHVLMEPDTSASRANTSLSYQQANLLENIRRTQPQCVVIVGYQPGFASLLERLSLEHIPIVLYAPPFYSQWQAEDLSALETYSCAHVFGVFPFEDHFYTPRGIPYTYVGSPHRERAAKISVSRAALGLPADKKVLLLLPGSRSEVFQRLMPRMLKATALLRSHFDLHVVLPIAEGITKNDLHMVGMDAYPDIHVVERMGLEFMSAADFAITGNGTVSLECQLLNLPHVALAHMSQSQNICNRIANNTMIPELAATAAPQMIMSHVKDLLDSPTQLTTMREAMTRQNAYFQPFAAEVAANAIEQLGSTWQKKGARGA